MGYQIGLTAPIEVSTSGDQPIKAAVPGKRIAVFYWDALAAAAVTLRWKSGSTNLTGPYAFQAAGGIAACAGVERPIFATGVGEALVLNLSAGVAVGGLLNYDLI